VFHQSGGFTGAVKSCELPLADLSPAQRAALTTARSSRSSPRRDGVGYRLVIERSTGRRTVVWNEQTVPTTLKPLIRLLAARARPDGPRPDGVGEA
jgi:hypothetical protein